jgi:hypothetical protein
MTGLSRRRGGRKQPSNNGNSYLMITPTTTSTTTTTTATAATTTMNDRGIVIWPFSRTYKSKTMLFELFKKSGKRNPIFAVMERYFNLRLSPQSNIFEKMESYIAIKSYF